MSDDYRARATITGSNAEDIDECRTDIVRKILIQLIGIDTADVVSLDDRIEIAHPARLSANHRSRLTTTVHDRTVHPSMTGSRAQSVQEPAQEPVLASVRKVRSS